MIEGGEHHAIVDAGIFGIVSQKLEAVAVELLDAEMGVVFWIGDSCERFVLNVEITDGVVDVLIGFEVHVDPFLVKILDLPCNRVDLSRDAKTACHGHEEDVA